MIRVIEPGFYSSVQDLGRSQYTELGVPISGCMDRNSAYLANQVLGNAVEAAVLECTMTGPVLAFTKDTFIALGGAHFEVYLDDKLLKNGMAYAVRSHQVLKFGRLIKGMRIYLAVTGGIQSEMVLGSRSFYVPITKKNRLAAGEELLYLPLGKISASGYEDLPAETPLDTSILEAYQGPEWELLPIQIQEQLVTTLYTINKRNNRMAYQFDPPLDSFSIPFITSPVLPGTIQYTPQGSLFALMRDGQTTGGYLRVLQLTDKAMDALAQLKTGHTFRIKVSNLIS